MPTRLKVFLGVLAVLVAAVAAVGREQALTMLFGPVERVAVDFATLAPARRGNVFLVCPEDFCAARADAPSPVFDLPAPALRDRWMAMIARQPRVTRESADEAALQYDFVQRSWFFRFPDTVTVRFIPLDDGRSTLAVYSRSHYGYGDFGVNRRRIEAWLAALE